MGLDATGRRRWFGVAVLIAALMMLILGQTVLQGRLGNVVFLVYWLVCIVLTTLAMLVALADARVLRHRGHEQQRELLQDTLREIESEARSKHSPQSNPRKNGQAESGKARWPHRPGDSSRKSR